MDRRLKFGILLTDLSKTFDCLPHDLFVSKPLTYGFDDYLRHRKQRTKVADSQSSWQEILLGVPRGSILGPLLFNVDLYDLVVTMSHYDTATCADDDTPYVSRRNIVETSLNLQKRHQRSSFNGLEIISSRVMQVNVMFY